MRKDGLAIMMGNDHVAANVATAYIASNVVICAKASGLPFADAVPDPAGLAAVALVDVASVPRLVACVCAIFFFLLGSLLPDIDSPTSILGRLLPTLPLEHRGITHTIWAAGILGFAWAVSWRVAGEWAIVSQALLGGLFLGYVGHLLWDSCSRAGIAWLYPLTGYVSYGSGARVKKRHYVWLYRTGQLSEKAVVGALTALIFITAVAAWLAMPDILGQSIPGVDADDIVAYATTGRDIADRLAMLVAGPFTLTGIL